MTAPKVMRDLDAALADAVKARVEAANWKIKAGELAQRVDDLQQLVSMHETTTRELMRMVDTLRSERDEWRARASQ